MFFQKSRSIIKSSKTFTADRIFTAAFSSPAFSGINRTTVYSHSATAFFTNPDCQPSLFSKPVTQSHLDYGIYTHQQFWLFLFS